MSAGANCWFECSVTDSFGRALGPLRDGLGILSGSFCPHYDREERRRPVYRALVDDGLPAGHAADDGAALHFVGTELRQVVASLPGAQVYRVEPASEKADRAAAAVGSLRRSQDIGAGDRACA